MTGQTGWRRLWCMHTTNTNRGWTCTEANTEKTQEERRGGEKNTMTLKCNLIHDAKALTICSQPPVCDVRERTLSPLIFSAFFLLSIFPSVASQWPMGQRGSFAYCFSSKNSKRLTCLLKKQPTYALFSFVLASVSRVNQHPTVLPGPVLIVLVFIPMTLYLTVWIWWWWCYTRADWQNVWSVQRAQKAFSLCASEKTEC